MATRTSKVYKLTCKAVEVKGNKNKLAYTHRHKRVRPPHMKAKGPQELLWAEFSLFLNNLLLRFVHKTQTQQRQRSCIKERRARKPPEEWTKWLCNWFGLTNATPIHNLTRLQREARVGQDRNTWWAVSDVPQPATYNCNSWEIMPLVTKWSNVIGSSMINNHTLIYYLLKLKLENVQLNIDKYND